MTSRALTTNLTSYLSGLSSIDIPVIRFDIGTTKTLPVIVVGYDNEELSFKGGRQSVQSHGFYTVNGYVDIYFQGHDDETTQGADTYTNKVLDALQNTDLYTSLNALTGRPLSGFHLNGFIIDGVSREIDESSIDVSIKFRAFCVNRDCE